MSFIAPYILSLSIHAQQYKPPFYTQMGDYTENFPFSYLKTTPWLLACIRCIDSLTIIEWMPSCFAQNGGLKTYLYIRIQRTRSKAMFYFMVVHVFVLEVSAPLSFSCAGWIDANWNVCLYWISHLRKLDIHSFSTFPKFLEHQTACRGGDGVVERWKQTTLLLVSINESG